VNGWMDFCKKYIWIDSNEIKKGKSNTIYGWMDGWMDGYLEVRLILQNCSCQINVTIIFEMEHKLSVNTGVNLNITVDIPLSIQYMRQVIFENEKTNP